MFDLELCVCGQAFQLTDFALWQAGWEPGHGSGDPEMPACGGPKYGTSHIPTALIFPRVYPVF